MSLPATLSAFVLNTILARLAPLFMIGANGDAEAARHAALQMLGTYHPQTEAELTLAASIISFSLQALEALAQAAQPDLAVNRIIRLRGSAVSLSRESAKAQRSLTQLQKARQQAAPAEPQPETTVQPKTAQPQKAATEKTPNGHAFKPASQLPKIEIRPALAQPHPEVPTATPTLTH